MEMQGDFQWKTNLSRKQKVSDANMAAGQDG